MRACYVCVFVIACFGIVYSELQQVGALCRPNERLLSCGCPKTCQNPAPDCRGVCKEGCFCNDNEVRNSTGHCVKLSNCPPVATPYKLDTSEPRYNNGQCPENEEYRFCEPCNKTCENPNPICPAQCGRGCYCKGELLRDKDGRCVKHDQCTNVSPQKENTNYIKPIPYQITCNLYQAYKHCETCERTCSDPNPKCPTSCKRGCFCGKGYVKAPDGQCVKLEDCPKAEVTIGGAQDPSVEDCATDEEYFSCGWCEPTCSNPTPLCPLRVCTRGCLCQPPLLRHHSGHCVQEKDCLPRKCTNPDEEFVCRYGCEPRCGASACPMRVLRCSLGCHCRAGLLRDVTGLCVKRADCTNVTQFNLI